MKELVLVLGGVRAGKSQFAQRLAQEKGGAVLFVATAEARDEEMAQRIRLHQETRPKDWQTLEEPIMVPGALSKAVQGYDVVLLDCLTLWISNLLLQVREGKEVSDDELLAPVERLLYVYQHCQATFIVVSNEVGMGVVPPHPLGRRFRDLLGKANQMLAARSDKVYLLVAGLPLELKALGGLSGLGST